MASPLSSVMPNPGDGRLCDGHCNHADCEALRRIAACFCLYCEAPIGFGVRYVVLNDREGREHPVHEDCHDEEYEARRQELERQRFVDRGMLR